MSKDGVFNFLEDILENKKKFRRMVFLLLIIIVGATIIAWGLSGFSFSKDRNGNYQINKSPVDIKELKK